ncbi:MAG: NAD-dependent epimerase/dehydratase family protein [Halobacteriota archaeon]
MKVLVTGAAGFIGSHVVDALVERGNNVRALVRLGGDMSHLRTLRDVEIVRGDLTDTGSLKSAVQDVQQIYNVAAKTGPWGVEEAYRAVNVQGLADLIHLAMDAGVERIVHTSSVTVYGHHLRDIVTEDHPIHAENNPYSRSKIAGELLISQLVQEHGAPVVVVRPAWVYGPRDVASFCRFVNLVEHGKSFLIGPGNNSVPVVYVRDVAQAFIKAGDAGNKVIGRAYNIADDRRVTQAEYLNTIADALQAPHVSRKFPLSALYLAGRTAEVVWQAMGRRKGAPPPLTTYGVSLLGENQQFSIDRARRELGYAPNFDVKRGVAEGVRWYLEDRPCS